MPRYAEAASFVATGRSLTPPPAQVSPDEIRDALAADPGHWGEFVTPTSCLRYSWDMSSSSKPTPPSDVPSPLADRIAWLRANPPPPDPVHAWMDAHRTELAPHKGKRVAIDPARGILAVGADYGEVADQLDALGVDPTSGVVITPVFG
jgi:hypothetical protein